jgi:hypothetical protein
MLAPTFLGGGLLVTGAIKLELEVVAAGLGECIMFEFMTVRKFPPA